jgi:hypothetical protein
MVTPAWPANVYHAARASPVEKTVSQELTIATKSQLALLEDSKYSSSKVMSIEERNKVGGCREGGLLYLSFDEVRPSTNHDACRTNLRENAASIFGIDTSSLSVNNFV